MALQIKLFRRIQKIYRMTGIYPSSESSQNSILNLRNVMALTSITILLIASTAFTLFEAKSTAEYSAGSSASITVFTIIILFVINLFEVKNIIKLIGKFEDFIEQSENSDKIFNFNLFFAMKIFLFKTGVESPDLKIIYTEFSEKLEHFCEWIYIAIVDVSFCAVTAFLVILCYVNYYILGLKDASFFLSTPVMYVSYVS